MAADQLRAANIEPYGKRSSFYVSPRPAEEHGGGIKVKLFIFTYFYLLYVCSIPLDLAKARFSGLLEVKRAESSHTLHPMGHVSSPHVTAALTGEVSALILHDVK